MPSGYTTFHMSGSGPTIADPTAPGGAASSFGDTVVQTTSTLAGLKNKLAQPGSLFADVVQARAYPVGDPARGGRMEFAGTNGLWLKVFGIPDRPDKPARTTIQVAGLPVSGALVDIDLVAVKHVGS